MFTKEESRLRFKFMRDHLDKSEYNRLNGQLVHTFKNLPLDKVYYLHTFLPIFSKKEPNTFLLIEYLRMEFPWIKLIVSKSELGSNRMKHYLFHPDMKMATNKWGILEPDETAEEIRDMMLIDMVWLPLLAFDMKGNRVGYGKGYYDVFLSSCKKDVQKVGISLFDPVDAILDIESHDIPLDKCVTPEKVWTF